MKKAFGVVIFALIIIALVALVVFTSGTSAPPQQNTTRNQTQTQVTATTNLSILPAANGSSITLAQLAEHDKKTDCWVGYNRSAYDLTSWLPKHPGSSAAIEPYCGTAAEFEAAFKGQHGTSQVKTLLRESTYKGALQ
jgi:cytochrome b involved in lipid metabolism